VIPATPSYAYWIVELVAEPGKSKRMMPAMWGGVGSEEESREHLQSRLTTLWKVMFWAFMAVVLSQLLLYEVFYPEVKPRYQNVIYAIATVGLVLMAFIWRGVLVRNAKLSLSMLYGFDTFYSIASGAILGAVAVCAYDFSPAHYVCLIYAVYAVFTRAIVVPSSFERTLIVSTFNFVPMIGAALWLALSPHASLQGAPKGVFFAGAAALSVVAVVLAALGSDRIYGLRQKVSEVMQLGQYKLGRKIGEGGMGKVYEAHHVLLRRPTAIKLMHSANADNMVRFEAEVQAMSELTHPNTVAVYDYGQSDGVFYYAMEYLGDGINLAQLIAQGAQPADRVIQILAQVCGALAEAHARNLIHRDIKPANIILCERGLVPDVAKVVDFGLVKEIAADAAGPSTQIVVGTPHYLSPEQVLGQRISPASDLYALGLVGYELLTGKKPFEGKTLMEYATKHITAIPKRPSEVAAIHVPSGLENIVMKCLEKEPERRFPSATELAAALHALPSAGDWTEDDAHTWWRDFTAKAKAELDAVQQPTVAITINLGGRVNNA
jgi:serine/threonine-protein kinase